MENKKSTKTFEKFTWKIENFSRLTEQVYHEHFVLAGYPWTLDLYPKGADNENNYLTICLKATQTANMSEGWRRDAKFKLLLFNQVHTYKTITREFNHKFNAQDNNQGLNYFMRLPELRDPKCGFVKDVCIIGVEIFVSKSMLEKQVNQTVNLIDQTKVQVPSPTPEGRGLINLETILPFSSESVFAAVGRVLYFLKTRKVKDMNAQACKDLQVLWDELQNFQFDLTWLEPHVQSALGMKSYAERAMQVQKLKDSLVVLKLETKKLEEKLVAAEFNLYVESDLLKAKGMKEGH
ncbi:ubiquitin carboxyl-terminal hydrolase family protein [Trifolium pratense]|uniref:Ubiquitin carboxyl-terminal hydrolase family protein n=1 Tax=Trifolium pratense TaxID=57577 RepID=A0A2K3NY80_TRIPR|nr:ubiquitin carboxyl-terminal hydrolase family protein [Trifolium pratense]